MFLFSFMCIEGLVKQEHTKDIIVQGKKKRIQELTRMSIYIWVKHICLNVIFFNDIYNRTNN